MFKIKRQITNQLCMMEFTTTLSYDLVNFIRTTLIYIVNVDWCMQKCGKCNKPGYRFYPTDQELILHYLKNKVMGVIERDSSVADVDIYKHPPWDLPNHAAVKNRKRGGTSLAPKI